MPPADTKWCQCQEDHGSPPPLHLKQWCAEMHTKLPNLLCVSSDEYEWGHEYRWEKGNEYWWRLLLPPTDGVGALSGTNQSSYSDHMTGSQVCCSLQYTVSPQGVCGFFWRLCLSSKHKGFYQWSCWPADLCSVVVLAAFVTPRTDSSAASVNLQALVLVLVRVHLKRW